MGALSEVTLDKIPEQSLWPSVIVIDFTNFSMYYIDATQQNHKAKRDQTT
jgi:hypothetical protein